MGEIETEIPRATYGAISQKVSFFIIFIIIFIIFSSQPIARLLRFSTTYCVNMMSQLSQPLKWHGGKHYLAKKIIALMPAHVHYVEPYAGGLSVLLAKSPDGISEVVNDLNGELTNFWRVLQVEEFFRRFCRQMEATPFSEIEWRDACQVDPADDCVVRASKFFIRCRQSLAGRGKSFAPSSRTRTRRGMNEQASAWLTAIEGLPDVHRRLQRVYVANQPALNVIKSHDGPKTLFYLDPPYLDETRTSPSVYEHEMNRNDHAELLELIQHVQGRVMLSGYPSPLYEITLAAWSCHQFELPNHAAGGETKRKMIECVWCNY